MNCRPVEDCLSSTNGADASPTALRVSDGRMGFALGAIACLVLAVIEFGGLGSGGAATIDHGRAIL